MIDGTDATNDANWYQIYELTLKGEDGRFKSTEITSNISVTPFSHNYIQRTSSYEFRRLTVRRLLRCWKKLLDFGTPFRFPQRYDLISCQPMRTLRFSTSFQGKCFRDLFYISYVFYDGRRINYFIILMDSRLSGYYTVEAVIKFWTKTLLVISKMIELGDSGRK